MARIDHYEFGRIMIDGRQETKDLIVLPDWVVRNWWRQDGHALILDDLGEVLEGNRAKPEALPHFPDPQDVARYAEAFKQLLEVAATGEDSLVLLERITTEIRGT
jgi:hypothetical protein